jgi:hypothetical protein
MGHTASASITIVPCIMGDHPMPPVFRFRLNGDIMPEIVVQRAPIHGVPVGEWQIIVDTDGLGRFTIDDNSDLWEPSPAAVRVGVQGRNLVGVASYSDAPSLT